MSPSGNYTPGQKEYWLELFEELGEEKYERYLNRLEEQEMELDPEPEKFSPDPDDY